MPIKIKIRPPRVSGILFSNFFPVKQPRKAPKKLITKEVSPIIKEAFRIGVLMIAKEMPMAKASILVARERMSTRRSESTGKQESSALQKKAL